MNEYEEIDASGEPVTDFDGEDGVEAEYFDDGTAALIDEDSALTGAEELASRVRRLVELRTRKDETEAAAKTAKEEFVEYQAQFYEEYEKSPLTGSINVNIGGDFGTVQLVPRSTKSGRVLNYDKAVQYFRERGQLAEFTRNEIRKGRINDLVKECIEQKKPLPDGIDYYTKEYFTITFKG